MAQLRLDYQEFEKRDTVILAIGPEKAETLARYFSENGLPFIGIPDPAHRVLLLYGQEINLLKLGRMPAQALVDKYGTVRYVHYGSSMSDIPENAELLARIDGLNAG